MLLDLVNATNERHLTRRWRHYFEDWPDVAGLADAQKLVRFAWPHENPNDVRTVIATMVREANESGRALGYIAPHDPAGVGAIVLNPRLFRLALAEAVARYYPAMRICVNPDCPARYFLGKQGQRACERGPCSEWAQRLFKREWWAAHKEQQMAQLGKSKQRRKGK